MLLVKHGSIVRYFLSKNHLVSVREIWFQTITLKENTSVKADARSEASCSSTSRPIRAEIRRMIAIAFFERIINIYSN